MPNPREAQFRQLVSQFPDSSMGYFSLGKLLLEEKRFAEAAETLDRAVQLQPDYAAALLMLGNAWAGAGQNDKARAALERAKDVALAQNHPGMAEDAEALISEL